MAKLVRAALQAFPMLGDRGGNADNCVDRSLFNRVTGRRIA